MASKEHQQQLDEVLMVVRLPIGIAIRAWTKEDFPAIQRISTTEGWTSPIQRPADSLSAWQHSWPALVAVKEDRVVGFLRALTDEAITMFVAEMAVDPAWRSHGIGRAMLDTCHALYPTVRLDLLAVDEARSFYKACGFRLLHDGMRKSYR